MSATFVEVEPIKVWRAFAPDIAEVEGWLIPRLMTLYPDSTYIGLRSRLMLMTVSNEEQVVRTQNAVAAIRSVPENLTGVPYAKVWFALGRSGEGDVEGDEIAELHRVMLTWMRRCGMETMILSDLMDCDRSYIRHRIGKLTKYEVHAWHLGQQPAKEG
jgi:hypothetical protein